jgi:hypothetical protein
MAERLKQIAGAVAKKGSNKDLPWDPDAESFPTRKELSGMSIENAPPGAAWVWGADDQIGRLNLLTPTRVANAANKYIKDGDIVSLK